MTDSQTSSEDRRTPAQLFLAVFPSIVLPMFLAIADGTIVSSALPAIASAFGDVERVSWIVIAYLVANTIAAPVFGYLSDVFGRRRLMFAALTLFVVSSLLCSIANSILTLTAARVLQGLGGGGMMAISQALIGEAIPARQRGNFQGYLAAVAVSASAVGPVMGGYLTEHLGWHSVFLINVPLGLLAIGLTFRLKVRAVIRTERPWQFDMRGLVYFVAFVVPLLLAVEQLRRFDLNSFIIAGVLLAVSLLSLFLLLGQESRASSPLLPIAMLSKSAVWRADGAAVCHGAAMTALVTFLPLYVRAMKGGSASDVGLLLLPVTAGIGVGSMITGRFIARSGYTMIYPSAGLIFGALFMALFAVFGHVMPMVWVVSILTAMALCMGTVMAVVQVTVQQAGGARYLGAAAASVQFSRSVGAAVGTALVSAGLFASLGYFDQQALTLFGAIIKSGPSALGDLEAARRIAVEAAVANSFRTAFLLVAFFMLIGSVLCWTNPARRV